MSVIKMSVVDQKMAVKESPVIASQGVNEDYVQFFFDEVWDQFSKTALFYREDDETVYQTLVDENNMALVPHEVTEKDGLIWFGVAGVNGDIIYTSEVFPYKIVKGIYVSGEESTPVTPDVYQQILTSLGSINSRISQVIAQSSVSGQEIKTLTKRVTAQDAAGVVIADANFLTSDYPELAEDFQLLDIYWVRSNLIRTESMTVLQTASIPIGITIDYENLSEGDQIDICVVISHPVDAGNAELEDIRVGYDGTVYPTAGDAVRAQIEEAMQTNYDNGDTRSY